MARFPPIQSDPPAAKAATPLRTGRSGTNIAMEVALKGLAFARERSGNRDRWVWWMADNRPLSDNEADDRLKAALNALGEAPGVTVAADTALAAARKALSLLSLGLIAAGVKRELKA